MSEEYRAEYGQEPRQSRPVKKKKRRKKKRFHIDWFAILCVILFIAISVAGYLFFHIKNYDEACDPNDTELRPIFIPEGKGPQGFGDILEEAGVIADSRIFVYKTRINASYYTYQHGNFLLSPAMTMEQIIGALQHGAAETIRFTLPEGYTMAKAFSKLEDENIITAAEMYEALEEFDKTDYWFLADLQPGYPSPDNSINELCNMYEGFIFPSTYEFLKGSSGKMILCKFFDAFEANFTSKMREDLKASGRSIQELITIASLVEREVALDEERGKCASVVYNRLKEPMKLQFCSTVQYILGDPKASLTIKDTQIQSPYNSYINEGLPPGPIASPGVEAIRAALYPDSTKYLFFVLKSNNGKEHVWCQTYDQFLKAKNTYKTGL